MNDTNPPTVPAGGSVQRLVRHHRTPHGHARDCRYVTKTKNCNCMTKAEHRRYLDWLDAATSTAP